ncbi:PAQR family membrane homeostasis protein TrhA [Microvirga splendida]|uniref:Hemolysin III family protein n=1 Tax=Microvirga splendida TaxID=2795727 RepID=A0ABS0XUS9_9HYPH|nr:hemolysin III family protein [Microvirga splendida]MBJ6123801.1 hemolysin III family protein [Microvirga splendida]
MIADGMVHAVGVTVGTISVIALLIVAAPTVGAWEFTSILVYGTGLLAVLTVSALYNLWPVSPVKWMLRRFDHSAIYLLIAGTYTPFITQMKASAESLALLAGIWLTSAVGIALKLRFPGRFDRLSIVLYLLLSWSGVMAYESVFGELAASTIWLLAIGGIIYTAGVVFHLWESLRFQNAIWHGFVLVAAACHYGAVLDCLVLARS